MPGGNRPIARLSSVDQQTCLVVAVSELVELSFKGFGGFASAGPPFEFCGEDVDLSLQLVFAFDQLRPSGAGPFLPPGHWLMLETHRREESGCRNRQAALAEPPTAGSRHHRNTGEGRPVMAGAVARTCHIR